MKTTSLGQLEQALGRTGTYPYPGARLYNGNCLVWPLYGTTLNAVRILLEAKRTDVLWQIDLKGATIYRLGGLDVPINIVSAIPAETGYAAVAGGKKRLVVAVETGEIRSEGAANSSPTAPASRHGDVMLVPEGQVVSAYDLTSMELKWKRTVPDGMWALAPSTGPLIPIEDPSGSRVALWHCDHPAAWSIPHNGFDVVDARAAPVLSGSVAVVPIKLSAPELLAAIDHQTGESRWSMVYPRPDPAFPMGGGTAPFPYPTAAVEEMGQVVSATAEPSVVCLDGSTGATVWSASLPGRPTALSLYKNIAWVAVEYGELLALDQNTGEIHGRAPLHESQDSRARIESLAPISTLSAPSILAVSFRGSVFHVEL